MCIDCIPMQICPETDSKKSYSLWHRETECEARHVCNTGWYGRSASCEYTAVYGRMHTEENTMTVMFYM